MASVGFFYFFPTYFVNLEFVHFVIRPLRFLILQRYNEEQIGCSVLVF